MKKPNFEKIKKFFKGDALTEIHEYVEYSLVFGIPVGLALLCFGQNFLIGLGIGSLLWVADNKVIKMLRSLWFR